MSEKGCTYKGVGGEYLEYIFALEYLYARSALKTTRPEAVAEHMAEMRDEFAPHVQALLAPIGLVVAGGAKADMRFCRPARKNGKRTGGARR